jgi:hypothetical protein
MGSIECGYKSMLCCNTTCDIPEIFNEPRDKTYQRPTSSVREVWYFFCFSFYSVLISGISQVVLQHNIDLYPHSIEPIKTSTFID